MIVEHLEINPENFINNDQNAPPLFEITLHLANTARQIPHTINRTFQIDLTAFILGMRVGGDRDVLDQPGEVAGHWQEPGVFFFG